MALCRTTVTLGVLLGILCLSVDAFWFLKKTPENVQAKGEVSEDCLHKMMRDDCDFYQCLDERFPCKYNWARKYGLKFCKKFQDNLKDFTEEGQRWVNGTRTCTMLKMGDFYEKSELECRDFHHKAEHIYSQCSQENGVCSATLMWRNKGALKNVFFSDISRESAKMIAMMFKQCSKFKLGKLLFWFLSKMEGPIHG